MVVYYKKHYDVICTKTTFTEFCDMLGLSKKERRKLKKMLKKKDVTIHIPRRLGIDVSRNNMNPEVSEVSHE